MENKDGIVAMKAEYKDENTGKEEKYSIAYSQILQEKIEKKLKINNILLWILIILLGAFILALLFRSTGVLILQKIACIGI